MKIVFIRPPEPVLITRGQRLYNRRWPPLSLLNCAAIVRSNGGEASVVDLVAEPDADWQKKLDNASMVLVTTSSLDRWQCPQLDISASLQFIRNISDYPVCVTGVHGTLAPEWMLKRSGAAAVLKGEPEVCVARFSSGEKLRDLPGISCREGRGIRHNPPASPLDMRVLPTPAMDSVKIADYHYELLGPKLALLETSRGCPHDCSFCAKDTMYGGQLRLKSMKQISDDIDAASKAGARNIYFFDLEFGLSEETFNFVCDKMRQVTPSMKWTCQTRLDLLSEEQIGRMAQAGCKLIHFGVESADPAILCQQNKPIKAERLKRNVKRCKIRGIETAGFFLLGFEGETLEQMEQTVSFSRELNPSFASFHPVMRFTKETIIDATEKGNHTIAYENSHLDPEQLDRLIRKAYLRFYLSPASLARLLPNLLKPRMMGKAFKMFRGYVS